ncbi:hypothetical protein LTS14_009534 [Recurvomyces mirabilis]|uniref:uncharacterized protein n=1 Tax=Recurvomyces mirabilis TaxID=574656 RepID=UPI002DE0650A|nr:hypothetical protein LTS14_009534 [Recurvomyces mirabilis]
MARRHARGCVQFEYDCYYEPAQKRRQLRMSSPTQRTAKLDTEESLQHFEESSPTPSADDDIERFGSREANSSAAFVRKLAVSIDPANAPPLHLFAWNLFMGTRKVHGYQPVARPITSIVSRATMESLFTIYLDKFDRCYGFINKQQVAQRIQARWQTDIADGPYDAILCGIAAAGYLFSCRETVSLEMDLIESAKQILDRWSDLEVSVDIVQGWVLRVAYMRMTAAPHAAWVASCTMMHLIDAARLHIETENIALPDSPAAPVNEEERELHRRIVGIARHSNVWLSFDLGRSRVALHNSKFALPTTRPHGDFTTELLRILPLAESLDPQRDVSLSELKSLLKEVLSQQHTEPPSVLAQTNMTMLICRRLRALDVQLTGSLLDDVLALTARSLRGAQAMLNASSPWHHVANVPFQVVCILLAIDSPAAIGQLGDAIKTLSNVSQGYNTDATREALNTACLLVWLQQKRKEKDTQSLTDILSAYSPAPQPFDQTTNLALDPLWSAGVGQAWAGTDSTWLDSLVNDMPNLQGLDFTQLLEQGFQ